MKKTFLIIILFAFGCARESIKSNLTDTLWVRHQGADMPVYVHGNIASKVVVLIVHGGPGGNGPDYRSGQYAEDLESKYAVAYWDQRGQGMSQGKYAEEDVTIETMATDMRAVIQVLKSKYNQPSIFVLGHSWGGTLSAKYMTTSDYQSLVKGWIEADGAHDIPKLNIDAVKMYIQVANEQITLGNSTDKWKEIRTWASAIDTNNITDEQAGEINKKGYETTTWLQEDAVLNKDDDGGIKASFLKGHTNPLLSYLSGNSTSTTLVKSGIESVALSKELHKVTIPCLFLWGQYDFVVPPSLGEDALAKVSSLDKKLVIYAKSAHSPMNTQWETFNKEIIAFVERNK